jgi:hypothetical protein
MRTNALLFLSTVLLMQSACDCYRVVSASVLDAENGKPVAGVSIRERHDNGTYEDHQDLTDAQGLFEFSDISGGIRRCPPVQLHLSREGYVPIDREFGAGTHRDTVLLKRERAF